MSRVVVTGYYGDGISYGVILDTDGGQDVVLSAPVSMRAEMDRLTGEAGTLVPMGREVVIGTDSIEAALAYLATRTTITTMEGDLPEDMTADDGDVVH